MNVTPYQLAERFVGQGEFKDDQDNPWILAWHSLCGLDPRVTHDEVPWCSAFVNAMAWQLRLPRSKNAAARSWLGVGTPVPLEQAQPGYDVAVLWRVAPTSAYGHVGFYAGHDAQNILLLGGNQNDTVCVAQYPLERLLGIRRLVPKW